MSSRARIVATIGAAIVLVVAAGGITYAATANSTSTYGIACINASHALRGANANATCPAGYSHIDVAAAPTALLVSATSSPTATKHATVNGIDVETLCAPNSQSSLYLNNLSTKTSYRVGGQATSSGPTGTFTVVYQGGPHVAPSGSAQVSYTQPASAPNTLTELVDEGGDVTADILVIRSGHTFTVHFYATQTSTSCTAAAQVTPSS